MDAVLEAAGVSANDVRQFSHGMTVATNALLEGRGARTVFVATEGFTDLIALGRQDRRELYRLCAARAAPLTPPQRRIGVPERMTPDGPLRELTGDAATTVAQAIAEHEPEAVAVCLLHSYRHPEHEQVLAQALAAELPDVHVSLSHEVVGTFREFERAATTEVDAALSPLLAGYLRRLVARCEQAGVPEPAIMQSNGGLIDLEAAAGHAAWTVLSGPAAGAAGAAFVARAAEAPDALCFDMGGTSCDVCVVDGGAVQEQSAARSPSVRWPCRWSRCTRSGGRRLDRLARPGRRAAGRAPVGRRRPGPGVLRPRRHRADGHRRQPPARLPGARRAAGRRRGAGPRRRSARRPVAGRRARS